ncbi:MAG: alanine racemase [candidate division WOR-3 bacterium]
MDLGRIWAEIDLNALRNNLNCIKNIIGNKKILLAIKADAYGHGAKEIALELQNEVDMLGVAGVEEGISIRYGGVHTPILILSPIPYFEIDTLWEYDLIPTVSEMEFARFLYESTKTKGANMHIHIEVDTGMGRTGLDYDQALFQIQEIASFKSLIIDGIFTHFPSADSDPEFTKYQIDRFETLCHKLNEIGIKGFIRHASNSAGFLNFPNADFDMIRPGLMVYGISPRIITNSDERKINLMPVMSLRSRIVNLRSVPKGYSISYDRKFITKRDSTVAVVSVGYGDGYPYALNNGEVIVQLWDESKRAKIIGNICMDMIMIDVTDIPGVKIGDIVTLLGSSDNQTITAQELARWANTIPYEITCRVSPRVPRVFIKNQKIVSIRNLLRVIGDHRLTPLQSTE